MVPQTTFKVPPPQKKKVPFLSFLSYTMEFQPQLQINVKDPVLVFPKTPTPKEILYLSPLDKVFPNFMYTLYVYRKNECKSNETVFEDLRKALEVLLVLYYPAAGRILYNDKTGHPELVCFAQGAMMVEASTHFTIKDLGNFSEGNPAFKKLVWHLPFVKDSPVFVAQVTKFACGGFSIGLGASHELFDGPSCFNFLSDWSRIVRKVPVSEIEVPTHNREIMKPRPSEMTPHELEECFMKRFEGISVFRNNKHEKQWEKTVAESANAKLDSSAKYVSKCFEVNNQMIEALRKRAMEGGHLKACSTFDILTAHSWLSRIKALEMKPTERILLQFPVNGRPRTNPPTNAKFIGNASITTFYNSTVEEILESPFHSIVKMVQMAKNRVSDSYIWDFVNAISVMDKQVRPSLRETTVVIDWTRIRLEAFDFGWGGAIFGTIVSLTLDKIYLLPGGPKGNVWVTVGFLSEVMAKFEQHFHDINYVGPEVCIYSKTGCKEE